MPKGMGAIYVKLFPHLLHYKFITKSYNTLWSGIINRPLQTKTFEKKIRWWNSATSLDFINNNASRCHETVNVLSNPDMEKILALVAFFSIKDISPFIASLSPCRVGIEVQCEELQIYRQFKINSLESLANASRSKPYLTVPLWLERHVKNHCEKQPWQESACAFN